ncbi:hypothetical protein R1flu_005854 [Riccia fluitans]|uniref:indole-3-glycerol-phosphate synthase n=1 Tax=Riccia fluitans TaxID=41844 RepID=A0ABD1YV55_9MARC
MAVALSTCSLLGTWKAKTSTRIVGCRRKKSCVVIAGQASDDDGQGEKGGSRLSRILKTKQRILQAQLSRLENGQLEERLSSLQPYSAPYRLLDTIAQQLMQGKTTVVAEIARLSPSESLDSFSSRCAQYVEWGADALAVCTDEEKSPNGAADLAAACKAVNVPVLRKDWIIHPLQVAETREVGASSITAVYSILGKGAPAILQYAISLGLDAIVEVVNLQELQEVEPLGAPLYGINLSVGLTLSLPGVRMDLAKGLVGEIPFGASSVVGVWSIEEATELKAEGVDAVYVRHEVLQGRSATEAKQLVPQAFLQNLRDAMTGDD